MVPKLSLMPTLMLLLFGVAMPAHAGSAPQTEASSKDSAKTAAEPSSLVVLFDTGSSALHAQDEAVLDRVSRVYNEGKPIIMRIAGGADLTGNPQANLVLSQQRANVVLRGLLDRGIPADRFQLIAKGQTDPSVPTAEGVAEAKNRTVVISWH